jgi:uncharacterized membrane protein
MEQEKKQNETQSTEPQVEPEVKPETGVKKQSNMNDNMYAILSYLFILCLIPVLMKKENEFVRFHARQGLVLFIAEMAVAIIAIVPLLGPIIYVLGMLICGLLSLAGIIQVLRGIKWEMPVVYDLSQKIEV